MKKYKTDWPKNIMKSRFSVILGKLDNIESLLKKHMIFVLLCFAQISQTLHVCGAAMKFAYFFARNSNRRFTWVVCEIDQNISEKMGDINLFLIWIQVKTFENLRKKPKWCVPETPKKTQKVKCCSSEVQKRKKSCKKLPERIEKSTKVS